MRPQKEGQAGVQPPVIVLRHHGASFDLPAIGIVEKSKLVARGGQILIG